MGGQIDSPPDPPEKTTFKKPSLIKVKLFFSLIKHFHFVFIPYNSSFKSSF